MTSASEVTIARSLSIASIVMMCSSSIKPRSSAGEILVELLLVVANRNLGAAVIDDVRHLVDGVGDVDRCGDACCGADAHLGDHPVAAVVADERHTVAGLYAERYQALREVAYGLPVLAPGGRNPATIRAHLDERFAVRPLDRQSCDLSG